MSKMDALRAMREARYERAQARSATPAPTPRKRTAAAKPVPAEQSSVTQPAAEDESLCGHRNMSGRTCTRERGHAAKSHRYS